MQNAADLGVFYQCEEYACILHEFDFVRIFTKCEILVRNM